MNPFLQDKPKVKLPFDATPAGIASNTFTGLPSAAVKVAKDIGQGIARSAASVALTAEQPLGGPDTWSATDFKSPQVQALWKGIFGSEPVQSVGERINQVSNTIQESPFAQKTGLSKYALPLAFGGVIGGDALNLTPFGGVEKGAAEALVKETTAEGALNLLTKMNVPEEIATKFAPHFADANNTKAVQDILDNMKGVIGVQQGEARTALEGAQNELSYITDTMNGHPGKGAGKFLNWRTGEFLKGADAKYQDAVGQDLSGSGDLQTLADQQAEYQNLANRQNELKAQIKQLKPLVPKIPTSPPQLTGTPVERLTQAIKNATPVRGKQEALYAKAKSERVARLAAVQRKTTGEKGFYAELGQLKGELPKTQYDSIRLQFSQHEADALFNMIKDHPQLSLFDQINGRAALAKMFSGTVPTNSELKILSKVYPKDMIDALLAKRPFKERFLEGLTNALNIPRSLMSSFDLSAPLRQGVFFVGRKEFYKSFASMFKQFGSERAFQGVQQEIASRPSFNLMKDSGLALTEMDRFISDREERFMSNWAEKIPVAGRMVKASGRAYVGFLNKLRADTFDTLIKQGKQAGIDFSQNEKALKDVAKFINSATGRGDLGFANKAGPLLNAVFFSPRLMASRLNLLNPVYYASLDPFVRKQAIKSLLSFGSIATTVLTLAKLGGASVGVDPTNADFGKIRVGNTRYDVLGGFQQYVRLASQLLAGKITSSTTGKTFELGKGYKPLTRKDIIIRFFQGKENPIASFVTDYLQGTDYSGKPFNLSQEVISRFIPLIAQDLSDALKEWGPSGLLTGIPATFGVGTQTYGAQNTTTANPFTK